MKKLLSIGISSIVPLALLLLSGCDGSDPAYVKVANGFPGPPEAEAEPDAGPATFGGTTVYKVWYRTTLIVDAVKPGQLSTEHLIAPGGDYAYALLAPGWAPELESPPQVLVAVKTAAHVGVAKGESVTIALSDATVRGQCTGNTRLSEEEYTFIAERIFPGDSLTPYDPIGCGAQPSSDAGAADAAGE